MSGELVGVDLGGTNIRAAAATGPLTHGKPVSHRTPAPEGPGAVMDAIAAAVHEVTGGAPPAAVAVGIPGPSDPAAGIVYAAPHLSGWTDVPAQRMLEERLGCPVVIHNDAILAGYAEWVSGAGMGTRNFAFVTASTGIGGCLVVDGRLVSGAAGTAGEVGHMPVSLSGYICGQGHVGCLEGAASGTSIARRVREALAQGEPSTLSSGVPDRIDAQAVHEAAAAGDELGRRAYAEAGRALGRGIGGLINLMSPEIVVVGGGLINAGDLLFAPLRAGVAEIAFEAAVRRCRIVPAGLGTDAGLIGAVSWSVTTFGPAG